MTKVGKENIILWSKRFLVYVCGLFCIALGIAFSARSGLGVGPVGSPANVLYQIGLAKNAPAYVNLGNCTTLTYIFYILVQVLILRRDFKATQLLQLVVSFLFGYLVNLAALVVAPLPDPVSYPARMLYLLVNIPLVALGVVLYLSADFLPNPGEGVAVALTHKTKLTVPAAKTLADSSYVVLAMGISLIFFRRLVGVREGTVICALLTGFVMKQFQKLLEKPLLRFTQSENRLAKALRVAEQGYSLDAKGKPKIIVAIGREYGAGGYEIGKLLAERLGFTFYDRQLNVMAAEQSGMSLEQVEALESRFSNEAVYDFKNAAYDMVDNSLSPEERLFVAQSSVIKQIAAGDESCVIMGRCADYVLYDNPNCFRVFIHAIPRARIHRTMVNFGLSREAAERRIRTLDAARRNHYRHFTGRKYGQQEYYQLSIDSSTLGTEESVELLAQALRIWGEVRGTQPLSKLSKQHQPGS